MRAYLARQLNQPLPGREDPVTVSHATIDSSTYQRHGFALGSTGSGKSRALLHLLLDRLRAGTSVVLLDGKGETIHRLICHLVAENVSPAQVTLLDPAVGPPGWNPLASGLPLLQAVGDLRHVVEETSRNWGSRLGDLLTNALIVAGTHQLSLYEAMRLLVRDDYRNALLEQPGNGGERLAYAEAHSFFTGEYDGWSRGERLNAVCAVTNKVREWLRSPFLRALLCARQSTLDLPGLWRKPAVVLVKADLPVLGDDGARLLVSLLCNGLLRTALRAGTSERAGNVLLALDELGILQRYIGPVICDTLAVARSQGLSLLCCFQHLEQLPEQLQASLLGNCGYQLLFRMGPDARLAAASLGVGYDSQISRLSVAFEPADRLTGAVPQVQWSHPIRDAAGRPLRLSPRAWTRFQNGPCSGFTAVERLRTLALAQGARRLYVRAADSGEPVELCRYVRGVPDSDLHIAGPSLQLIIHFPKPKVSGVQRTGETDAVRSWTRCLQELPTQHCVLRLAGRAAGVVRVTDLPTPQADRRKIAEWMCASVAANGQTPVQVDADIRWREAELERVAAGRPARRKESADESIF